MVIKEVRNPYGVIISLLSPKEIMELLQNNKSNIVISGEVLFNILIGRVVAIGNKITDVNIGDLVAISPTGAVRWNDNKKTYLYFSYNELIAKFEEGK